MLARTGAREALAVAEVDAATISGSRTVIDHLADRRPDAYLPPAAADAAFGIGL